MSVNSNIDQALKDNVKRLAKIRRKLLENQEIDMKDITFLYNSTLILGVLLEHLKGVDIILDGLSKVDEDAIIKPIEESQSVH